MAGKVAYHLLAQAHAARGPWPVTTIVSCLPVLVLAMGTALAHMLRADAPANRPGSGTIGPAAPWSPDLSGDEQDGPDQDHAPVGGFGLQDPITRSALEKPVVDVRTTARRSSGAAGRPQACRSREAAIPAGVARRRRHGLQRIAECPGAHAQCRTS
jgi:hypothetical protein